MNTKKRSKKRSLLTPDTLSGTDGTLGNLNPSKLDAVADNYTKIFESGTESRTENYQTFTNDYYDLSTDFFEFGWGKSFHFAPRKRGESFKDSLVRFEHFLADNLSLKQGMQILDLGSGVGGPMRTIAKYSGASITGINNNAYQIERAKIHTQNVSSLCRFIKCDFMQIPEADNSYDGAFTIEAMCHAPDKQAAFREVFRLLRPGSYFTGTDWCLTKMFDPENSEHQRIKSNIELGNGLSTDITLQRDVLEALSAVGFEIVEARDVGHDADPETPWYRALQSRDLSLSSIPRTPLGRVLTKLTLAIGEKLRIFPKGSVKVSNILGTAGIALVEGGVSGIMTPLYFFLARKPESKEN